MSIESALQRINQIKSMMAASPAQTSAQASPVQASSQTQQSLPTAATSFQAQMNRAVSNASGLDSRAWTAPSPVQNGKLDPQLFEVRKKAAGQIAERFNLKVTSDYRTPQHNAEVGGVPGSYHTKGLAFDFVGSNQDMQKAKAWAQNHPEMFQEVLVHDVGSGLHLHLAFKAS